MAEGSRVPQQVDSLTIGTRNVGRLRRFYEAWGWPTSSVENETPTRKPPAESYTFDVNGLTLTVYSVDWPASEQGDTEPVSAAGWNDLTMALVVASGSRVDEVWQAAVAAGARPISQPETQSWGGRAGFIADPDGTPWEIAGT